MEKSQDPKIPKNSESETIIFQKIGAYIATVHEIYENIFQLFCDVLNGDFDKAREIFDILGDSSSNQISMISVYIKRMDGVNFLNKWESLRSEIAICHERRGWIAHSKIVRPGGNLIVTFDENENAFKLLSVDVVDKFRLEKNKKGMVISTEIEQLDAYLKHAQDTSDDLKNFREAVFNSNARGKASWGNSDD